MKTTGKITNATPAEAKALVEVQQRQNATDPPPKTMKPPHTPEQEAPSMQANHEGSSPASSILAVMFGLIGLVIFGVFGLAAAAFGQMRGAEWFLFVAHLAIGGAALGAAVGALFSFCFVSQLHSRFWLVLAPALVWSDCLFLGMFLNPSMHDNIYTYGGLGLLAIGVVIGAGLAARRRAIKRGSPVFWGVAVLLLAAVAFLMGFLYRAS